MRALFPIPAKMRNINPRQENGCHSMIIEKEYPCETFAWVPHETEEEIGL
jgi:hypothetical protein